MERGCFPPHSTDDDSTVRGAYEDPRRLVGLEVSSVIDAVLPAWARDDVLLISWLSETTLTVLAGLFPCLMVFRRSRVVLHAMLRQGKVFRSTMRRFRWPQEDRSPVVLRSHCERRAPAVCIALLPYFPGMYDEGGDEQRCGADSVSFALVREERVEDHVSSKA